MIIKKGSYKHLTWKNGLGQTDEIAIHPANASLERGDFLWRISSARVEHDSAFSIFPDHNRILLVIEGDGVNLVQSHTNHSLSPLEPFEFGGEIETRAHLKYGSIRDLNVFTRKGAVSCVVEIRKFLLNELVDWAADSDWNTAIAVCGNFETCDGILNAGDAFFASKSNRLKALSENGIIVFISLEKIGK